MVKVFTQTGTGLLLTRVAANWPSLLPVCSQSSPSLLHYHIKVNISKRDTSETVLIPLTLKSGI